MSLFKVRDFWSFDLEALQPNLHAQNGHSRDEIGMQFKVGSFTADTGQFDSVGIHDVFVCGNLSGHLYTIQVPSIDQKQCNAKSGSDYTNTSGSGRTLQYTGDNNEPGIGCRSSENVEDRQLLAAIDLQIPVLDVKCGYFLSTMRQSISVLSLDQILIINLSRSQTSDDLLTNRINVESPQSIEERLLSHQLDIYARLDLIPHELARELVVVEGRRRGNSIKTKTVSEGSSEIKISKRDKLHPTAHQLHLPQRDMIVVQYENQFLVTLIDGKKIIGHFSMIEKGDVDHDETQGDDHDANNTDHESKLDWVSARLRKMSCHVGCLPMASMFGSKGESLASLVITFSDHRLYCVPVSIFMDLSKRNVVMRVAHSLIHSNKDSSATQPNFNKRHESTNLADNLKDKTSKSVIWIDIDSTAEWSHEMLAMPMRMHSVQRSIKGVNSVERGEEMIPSQLLVMCRYNLELFSSNGDHLWSQRFEAPLIQMTAYLIDATPDEAKKEQRRDRVEFLDQLVSLVCTDGLSADRCNLVILKDNTICWSALLAGKPQKIWRTNLSQIPGTISILDLSKNNIVASYLGTNDQPVSNANLSEEGKRGEKSLAEIVNLETLSGFQMENTQIDDGISPNQHTDEDRPRIMLETQLEAVNEWPNISVDMCAKLQIEPKTTSVIHNIVATLEFDDLLRFELISTSVNGHESAIVSRPSRGVVRLQLGNCWPDGRDPITFKGAFTLMGTHRALFGTAAVEVLERGGGAEKDPNVDLKLLPRSLRVSVILSYNETHSALSFIQNSTFILPISMIARLKYVDYTNEPSRNLEDFFNNLPYLLATTKRRKDSQKGNCNRADLFLALDCDILTILDEFVEGDLVCRQFSTEKRCRTDTRIQETMENLDLLAQSLDCRLRFRAPRGVAEQSSENLDQPLIASFAFQFNEFNPLLTLCPTQAITESGEPNVIVWIHVCDTSREDSSIAPELFTQHMKDWMSYHENISGGTSTTNHLESKDSKVFLIAIECNKPLPVLFFLTHFIQRLQPLAKSDIETCCSMLYTNNHGTYENLLKQMRFESAHKIAISRDLHRSVKQMAENFLFDYKKKSLQISERIARDSYKLQVIVSTAITLLKRLQGSPDDIMLKLIHLINMARISQDSLSLTYEEQESLLKLGYMFSKVPQVQAIKLILEDKDMSLIDWPNFYEQD